MQITWGKNYFDAKRGVSSPVAFQSESLINGHVLLVGSSGVGKSHTIRKMIAQGTASSPKVRFHVFDVHGDLDIPGASVAQFSEQATFGLNPLQVNPDPIFGGVRRAAQTFLRVIDQASKTELGVKQESVLRNLLFDVFRDFGFLTEEPSTWGLNEYDSRLVSGGADNRLYLEVPIEEKDEAKTYGARWDGDKRHWWVHTERYQGPITKWPPAYKARSYPNLSDVTAYAKRVYLERFLGSDQRAVRALGALNKKARALHRKMLETMRSGNGNTRMESSSEELESAKDRALEAYEEYVRSIQTGFELDSLIKYDSPDTLKSVVNRLDNLQATGIFKNETAPFDPRCSVWRYKLNALSHEEKKMMVLFFLQDIFNKAVQRGEQSDIVEVVVLDELSTYTSRHDESGEGVIGVIAREARKFGLAMWAANQTPDGVPESLIASVGTKIILGLDERYWDSSVRKLRTDLKLLEWIQPQRTMAVQMKERGALKNRWWWVTM